MPRLSDSPSLRGSGKRGDYPISPTYIKEMAYPKSNYQISGNLVSCMESYTQSTRPR